MSDFNANIPIREIGSRNGDVLEPYYPVTSEDAVLLHDGRTLREALAERVSASGMTVDYVAGSDEMLDVTSIAFT